MSAAAIGEPGNGMLLEKKPFHTTLLVETPTLTATMEAQMGPRFHLGHKLEHALSKYAPDPADFARSLDEAEFSVKNIFGDPELMMAGKLSHVFVKLNITEVTPEQISVDFIWQGEGLEWSDQGSTYKPRVELKRITFSVTPTQLKDFVEDWLTLF